jgi:hypothetical protein
LSQTNFLPDLMQVKVLPDAMAVFPAFGQADPVFTAAFARDIGVSDRETIATRATSFLSIGKG